MTGAWLWLVRSMLMLVIFWCFTAIRVGRQPEEG